MRMRLIVLALVLCGTALSLTGCGPWKRTNQDATPSAQSSSEPTTAPTQALTTSIVPMAIRIPDLKVAGSFVPTKLCCGLNLDATIQVPDITAPKLAGWYRASPLPGDKADETSEIGPSIILGHINGDKQQGIFSKLSTLKAGSTHHIFVDRSDGKTADFEITLVQKVPKEEFPTKSVYGLTEEPELRLISCGGRLDPQYNEGPAHHRYIDQIIVYGKLLSLQPTVA
jgi:hypothetical protein